MSLEATYNLNAVVFTLGGFPMSGGGENDFITITRNEQSWTLTTGASGNHVRSRSNNRSGQIQMTIMATSPLNGILQALLLFDEQTGLGVVPAEVVDPVTGRIHIMLETWIQGSPDDPLNKAVGERQWILEFADEVVPPTEVVADVFGAIVGL